MQLDGIFLFFLKNVNSELLPALNVDVVFKVTAENSLGQVGQEKMVTTQVEFAQFSRQPCCVRIQLIQIRQILLWTLFRQFVCDVILKPGMVNVEH